MKIPELREKNKAAARKWHAMSQDEVKRYFQLAAQLPTVSSSSSCVYDKWHETQRILSNLQDNVSYHILLLA